MVKKDDSTYQNNPFLIGLDGLKLVFSQAKGVGIYTTAVTASIVLLGIFVYIAGTIAQIATDTNGGYFGFHSTPVATGGLPALLLLVISGIIVYMAIMLYLFGITEYTAAKVAQGKSVKLGEAAKAVLQQFPGYVWVYVIVIVKVLLWSLLLIVPGFIMANRYILAGTVYFAEGKQGNSAIKRSTQLTKGAWLTTYGGVWLWNFISQSMAMLVFWPGSMAILYRQYSKLTDAGTAKPPAHIVSWLTLIVPFGLLLLYLLFMVALAALLIATTVHR